MKPKALDLFAGCGGLSVGFIQAGFDIVVASDVWKPTQDTYCRNHPKTKFVLGDITEKVVKADIVSIFKKDRVPCDVIIGGPPCQAYSMAGFRDPKDPRGKLFNDYVDIVEVLSPHIFVMENVKGILSMKHGNEKVIDKIVRRFKEIKYKLEFRVLDSADYGVPQHRERVIFIGTRHNIKIAFPEATHADGGGFDGSLKPYVTLRQAIDDLKNKPEDVKWSHIFAKHSDEFIRKAHETPIGSNLASYSESFFKANPNQPVKTVKANNGSVFIHYAKDRSMSPRELARLQSFPDDFFFVGTKHDVFAMIGNAVPCGLAKTIATSVKMMLLRIEKK